MNFLKRFLTNLALTVLKISIICGIVAWLAWCLWQLFCEGKPLPLACFGIGWVVMNAAVESIDDND
jgi:hypothetical protein